MVYEEKNVLIISPHPDDETLAAGGTILKYKDLGCQIYWLNITNMKEEYGFEKEKVKKRNNEIERIINEYEFDDFFNLELKPARLDEYSLSFIIGKISEIFNKIEPNIVIIPYQNDIHSDHRIVFESSHVCTKSFRAPYIKKVLMAEIISETDISIHNRNFSPNYFVDISNYFEKKIKIMNIYESEVGNHPFPRSIENIKALATLRGAMVGYKYAESFEILKEIW